jgi:ABC-type multidrug transport system permease subunit
VSSLLTIIAKDLRLLLRDRAALVFIAVAPIVVICVAGFSLANLYGADPTGQTAYELPIADEDGGSLAGEIRERLAAEPSVQVRAVATREDAQRLVREKKAGSALVIPRGTQAALERGEKARLLLYTDPVKYLERLNVRVRLLELRGEVAEERRETEVADASEQLERLRERLATLEASLTELKESASRMRGDATTARNRARRQLDAELDHLRTAVSAQVAAELNALVAEVNRAVAERTAEVQAGARAYIEALANARTELDSWLGELRRLAGRRASDIPPPPSFPEPPPELERLLTETSAPLPVPTELEVRLDLPLPNLDVLGADMETLEIEIPDLELPEAPRLGATLTVEEVSVTGASATINTFDQNVPGFSVTFLLLGMLLGVSLGLLDEHDWGTFDRVRAMPTPARNILIGKLLSRFVVGVVQMLVLFAIGWVAFDISLGPQPWALLLPIAGIVFAGTAFGLIVAVIASSREAVLPLGSIVIVTMAAIGGCWWPIDLEPRWMRSLALAFPTTWAMEAFNDLMIRRRPVEAALWPTTVMLAFGASYLVIGLALFRRRIARPR